MSGPSRDASEAFLPTLAAARALSFELPDEPPSFEWALAAVTVAARAQTRRTFDEKIEISLALAETVPKQPPPIGEAFVTATHRYLASASEPRACSQCAFNPGSIACALCDGRGTRGDGEPCMACDGEAWIRCAACDGTKRVVKAVIRRVEDHDYALRHTFVPESAGRFVTTLLSAVVDREPPEALRFELEARTVLAPYRTAEDTPRAASFLGHAFEDAIDRAREAVERLTLEDTLVRSEVQSWAWPFLLVTWPHSSPCMLLVGDSGLSLLRA